MFTGIVEEVGTVSRLRFEGRSAILTVRAEKVLEGTKIGDSIAVSGVCLTVVSLCGDSFSADAVRETLERSSLARLTVGVRVNLERAMPAQGRFGGHLVAGHVDGVGTVRAVKQDGRAVWYTIGAQPELLRYVVEKGSIALDGVSLTVAGVTEKDFCVSVIPHTAGETTLQDRRTGDPVNLEVDLVGKYVEKLLGSALQTGGKASVTREFLARCGF